MANPAVNMFESDPEAGRDEPANGYENEVWGANRGAVEGSGEPMNEEDLLGDLGAP